MTWQDEQTPLVAEIRRNLTDVQARIGAAAARAGRDVRDVTLLAVSKTVVLDRMQAAFSCGNTCASGRRSSRLLQNLRKPLRQT